MRLLAGLLPLLPGLLLPLLALQGCATTNLDATPLVRFYPNAAAPLAVADGMPGDRLRIMTFNIAHGRGEAFHQLLQRSATTLSNLDGIAAMLRDSGAHVVALQEADDPSFWSGNFSHVDYLASRGGFSRAVHGQHVDGLGLAYGTALVSRIDLSDPRAITFDPAQSPMPKGFVVSTIGWPGRPGIEIDVVSVHLDFASSTTRREQARELVATLRERQRPLVVMGDLNTGWAEDSSVRHICEALGLSAYRPEAAGLETFPAYGERLDWILVSPGISFHSYAVLPHTLSDHRGVIAELELAPDAAGRIALRD